MVRFLGQHLPVRAVILAVSESALVVLSLYFATVLQFREGQTVLQELARPETPLRFALVVVVFGLSLYYSEFYDLRVVRQSKKLLVRLLQAVVIAAGFLVVAYYFKPRLSLDGRVAAITVVSVVASILLWRKLLQVTGLFRGPQRKILVLGTGPAGIRLTEEIVSRPELNYKVVGFLDEKGENIGQSLVNPGIIGAAAQVGRIALREGVDQVVLSLAERRKQTPLRDLLQLKFAGIQVLDAHSVYEKLTGRILLDGLTPGWLISASGFCQSRFLLFAKRLSDIVFSLLGLLVSLPLMAGIAVLIWLETGTPLLFRQQRVGMNGRAFSILKFRTMHAQATECKQWAKDVDHQITRVGRWLRQCRFDELPQFFNVLRGNMSLIGPRPEQPHFCRMLEEEVPFFGLRHSIRPGITGWAQVKYQYGASVEESKIKLEYDLFYIKNLSLLLDLSILVETIKVVLRGKGAH